MLAVPGVGGSCAARSEATDEAENAQSQAKSTKKPKTKHTSACFRAANEGGKKTPPIPPDNDVHNSPHAHTHTHTSTHTKYRSIHNYTDN